MTNLEVMQSLLLGRVTFLPGSFDKKFCNSMFRLARTKPEAEITEAQSALLSKMFHRYRRQIPTHKQYCPMCIGAR